MMVLDSYEGFFELHSWATEQEKDKIGVQNGNFLANSKKFKSLQQKRPKFHGMEIGLFR